MRESLRARLLLWYALILTALIVVYGGVVSYRYRDSLLRDVDADLATLSTTIGRSLDPDGNGEIDLNLPPELREARFADGSLSSYYAVWDARGNLIDRSDPALAVTDMPPPGQGTRDGARELVIDVNGPARILVGRTLADTNRDVRALALSVGATGAGVLLLSLAGGWFLVGRALAPIARMSATASAMVSGDLTARISVKGTHSELEQVARALNSAFDRLQLAADSQRAFTADASHELRTPLATLRAEFEWCTQRPRSVEEYRETIEKAQRAIERMNNITDGLLALAREDHASIERHRTRVSLASMLDGTVALLRPLASVRGVELHTELADIYVLGDPASLTEAFTNLIKNAVEYNQEGGAVWVRSWAAGSAAMVSVRDTGVGISAAELPRIFDRFFRADKARSRRVGGAGLGLAIARKTFDEHGGSITCSSTPGQGSEFTVRLSLLTPEATV